MRTSLPSGPSTSSRTTKALSRAPQTTRYVEAVRSFLRGPGGGEVEGAWGESVGQTGPVSDDVMNVSRRV